MPDFDRHIGIDYSGAQTPTASLKGLRVYMAEASASPVEMPPPPGPRKYWTREGIAEWLAQRLAEDTPTLVGIDSASCDSPLSLLLADLKAPEPVGGDRPAAGGVDPILLAGIHALQEGQLDKG